MGQSCVCRAEEYREQAEVVPEAGRLLGPSLLCSSVDVILYVIEGHRRFVTKELHGLRLGSQYLYLQFGLEQEVLGNSAYLYKS